MLDIKTLLPELKKLVTDLSEDLLARSTENADVDAGLREAYKQIEKGGRTADAFEVWREDYLDQVAVAWVLGCVFVRFMEDNHLIDECWLAGDGERRKLAEDTHELYFREHPHESDREYFEHVFHQVGKIPACRDLFAEGKTPLWAVGPSGDMAMKLLAFWREIDAEAGHLARSFEVEDGDTRFLGDLYQDLSERARKKYALLQTPVFVEEFILDRTLDPAIDEFGLDEVRMIDPTCGSGHFLLGGFARLFDLWIKREDNEVVAAQKALDGIWGVDINPFAVAIARFRLIVAALRACGINRLKDAPAWNIHLATGDSLLFGSRWDRDGKKRGEARFLDESWAPEIYACEDKESISEVLGQQYHAVVGNPPYITVKDKQLNAAYRERFPKTCYRKYSLAVPFMERFFDLAVASQTTGAGFIGTITANSFMKREFGKKLIEDFFPSIELTHVIDAAGAFIPGHGTPTVILFGRNSPPHSNEVRAVLGINGEPSTPDDPSQGRVWLSITRFLESADSENEFVSSTNMERNVFNKHPWSLGGGGASDLKEQIDSAHSRRLSEFVDSIGFGAILGEEDAFITRPDSPLSASLGSQCVKALIEGENIRDWEMLTAAHVLFPYDSDINLLSPDRFLPQIWPLRTLLWLRNDFSKQSYKEAGRSYWEYHQIPKDKFKTSSSIAFAEVASHNHFVLDRSGSLFKQTAPIIKLPESASDADHLALLGILNSSTIGFYLKQVSHQKQMTGGDGVRIQSRAKVPYQFAGTRLLGIPLPDTFLEGALRNRLTQLASEMTVCVEEMSGLSPNAAIESGLADTNADIRLIHDEYEKRRIVLRSKMICLQEEIDFTVYVIFGFASEDLLCEQWEWQETILDAGMRPFEFDQQQSLDGFDVPAAIPSEWPQELQAIWRRRTEALHSVKAIRLIEDDHYKRRWIGRQGLFNHAARQDALNAACRSWMLERLSGERYWPNPEQNEPVLQSVSMISDKAQGDREFLRIGTVFRGREDFDVAALVAELVSSEAVPFLPNLRFKASGIRKRLVWEETWKLQRLEDAGEVVANNKVPPKYVAGDFQRSDYMRLRGPLDVPKERWISFPHCETESDPSLVVGWAGWNHLQQATALIAYYDARKREGWDAKRLTPLLAGLDQLLPWIHQWHPEVDPEFGETAGQSFETMLKADAHELGLTLDDIRAWEPPKEAKTRRKRKTK